MKSLVIKRSTERPTAKEMLTLSDKWASFLNSMPETGMGYVIVSVILKDGRRFDRVCVDGGVITKIGESTTIPFAEADIAELVN
jgi:hypothetical protein